MAIYIILLFKKRFTFICKNVCWYVHMHDGAHGDWRGHRIPWCWSFGQVWAIWCACWKQNSCPLQEYQLLLLLGRLSSNSTFHNGVPKASTFPKWKRQKYFERKKLGDWSVRQTSVSSSDLKQTDFAFDYSRFLSCTNCIFKSVFFFFHLVKTIRTLSLSSIYMSHIWPFSPRKSIYV